MLDSLLFLAVLIGTTWLCIWVLQDQRGPRRPWSPFDARHIGDQTGDAPKPSGRRAEPPPPWRRAAARRDAAGRSVPEPPPWRRRSGS